MLSGITTTDPRSGRIDWSKVFRPACSYASAADRFNCPTCPVVVKSVEEWRLHRRGTHGDYSTLPATAGDALCQGCGNLNTPTFMFEAKHYYSLS
jgi:hypothetical protein